MATETDTPVPPPPRSVKTYTNEKELIIGLKEVCEDWQLTNYESMTTDGDPNLVNKEAHRLAILKEYQILDIQADIEFDLITKEAQSYFNVPCAAVNLIDMGRQWPLSIQGFPQADVPRCVAFCPHVVQRKQRLGPMIVKDATLDPRFQNNPFVTGEAHLRFYAGAPLITPEGEVLGAFCILDFEPKPNGLSREQIRRLEAFAEETVYHMITRYAKDEEEKKE